MLGRKDFSPQELAAARTAVDEQLRAYRALADAVAKVDDPAATAALEALEPVLFTGLTVALDRYFVHRIRAVSGKDGNPLNEVELIVESVLAGDGVLRGSTVIKLRPERTVLRLAPGDRIRITADAFERLADAFLEELGNRFVGMPALV
jgi:hypothetical protein